MSTDDVSPPTYPKPTINVGFSYVVFMEGGNVTHSSNEQLAFATAHDTAKKFVGQKVFVAKIVAHWRSVVSDPVVTML